MVLTNKWGFNPKQYDLLKQGNQTFGFNFSQLCQLTEQSKWAILVLCLKRTVLRCSCHQKITSDTTFHFWLNIQPITHLHQCSNMSLLFLVYLLVRTMLWQSCHPLPTASSCLCPKWAVLEINCKRQNSAAKELLPSFHCPSCNRGRNFPYSDISTQHTTKA